MIIPHFILPDNIFRSKCGDVSLPVLLLSVFFSDHFKSLVIRQIPRTQTAEILFCQFIRISVSRYIQFVDIIIQLLCSPLKR